MAELAAPAIGGKPNVIIDGGASAVLSNSSIGAFKGDNIHIGVDDVTQGTQVLNCTITGVDTNSIGIAIGASNGSVLLGNQFSAAKGALNSTGIEMDYEHYAGTADATIHLNDVRNMATGIVCGHGFGVNCTNNPGAIDC